MVLASIESSIIERAPSHPSFPPSSSFVTPSQSKNHTNRNQSFKAHRNGIKKPKNYVSKSLKGVSACLLAYIFYFISGWFGVCACPL